MKNELLKGLQDELTVLTREQKSSVKGGGTVYGDGCCRPYYGAPPYYCDGSPSGDC